MMQKKVQIISDGSLDLSQELTKEKDIEVVPFYVSFDSETYQKEMVEVGVREFYQEMVDHPTVFPKTSMPSVHDYYEVFEKHAKEKMPVICICITRKFSGSLQSATTAKDMILEEYPDAQITVIDSTVNTVLQGFYVLEACRLRDMGLEYQQIVDALLPIRETGRIFFTIGSIDYLKHEVNAKPGEYSFCIGYGYDYNEALEFREMLKDLVKERLGIDEIGIYQIGATIGVHTGPYPIGIGIIKHALTE